MKNLDCFSKKRIYKWWLFRIYVKVYRKVSMKKMRSSSARQLIMRNPCTVNRGFVYLEIMELWLVDFQPRFIPRGYMFISQNWNSMCRNMGFVPTNHGDRQEHIWACLYAVFGAGTKKSQPESPMVHHYLVFLLKIAIHGIQILHFTMKLLPFFPEIPGIDCPGWSPDKFQWAEPSWTHDRILDPGQSPRCAAKIV